MNSLSRFVPKILAALLATGLLCPMVFAADDPDLDLTLTVLDEGQKPDEVFNQISLPEITPSAAANHAKQDVKNQANGNANSQKDTDHPEQVTEDLVNQNRNPVVTTPDVANHDIPVAVIQKAQLRDDALQQLKDLVNQVSQGKNMNKDQIKDLVNQLKEQVNQINNNSNNGKNN